MSDHDFILPAGEVCACLHETGSRIVHVYERCQRCHALTEADYLERLQLAKDERDRLRRLLADGIDCVYAYHGDPADDPNDDCAVCGWMRAAAALAEGSR